MKNSRYIFSGYLAFVIMLLVDAGAFFLFTEEVFIGVSITFSILFLTGFRIVSPNNAMIQLFMGKYAGMILESGFYWVLPIFVSTRFVSLKIFSTETEIMKVNDHSGNPIMIGSIIAWKVQDPYKALFCVEKYDDFVRIQTNAAVRKIASEYNYDALGGDAAEITLSGGGEKLNVALTREIEERVKHAGIEIIEARLGHLSYAPEIAQAMLKRQQASATIAARSKIVEGAVSMVDMALNQLSEHKIVDLKPEDKARMAINLLTVLCTENVQPTIQTNPNA